MPVPLPHDDHEHKVGQEPPEENFAKLNAGRHHDPDKHRPHDYRSEACSHSPVEYARIPVQALDGDAARTEEMIRSV